MKLYIILILLTAMSYSASSQNLTPKSLKDGKDTLLCFTIPQSRILAAHLVNSRYADSLLVLNEQQLKISQLQVQNRDSVISILSAKSGNLEQIGQNQSQIITGLNIKLQGQEKRLKRSRLQTGLCAAGIMILGAAFVLKK